EAVAYAGNIPQVDGRAIHLFQRDISQFLNGAWRAVRANVILRLADLDRSGGHHYVLLIDRVQQITWGDAFGLHRRLVHTDHDLALLATIRQGNDRPVDRDQLRPNEVGGVVIKLGLRQSLT